MEEPILREYREAGRIAARARDYGCSLIKSGVSLLEVTEKIEKKILALGGNFAFPPQISRNEIAAHYCAFPEDPNTFEEGDVIKVDIGVHINGHIADTASTVDLGSNNKLVLASQNALQNVMNLVRPGVKLFELGRVIQETILHHGFQPVKNLCGHGIGEYIIHENPSIPNYDNGSTTSIGERVIAIEPFATTGKGSIYEGKPSGIYALVSKKPVRDPGAREVLKFILEHYKTLPFTSRWIINQFKMGGYAIKILEKEGILYQYPQLPEKTGGLVSQAEHTFIVKEKPEITTLSQE